MQIEEFCKTNNLGNVANITKLTGGLMHKMFKVQTDKGTYAIKILNPEVMRRQTAYNNFTISETISSLAKENGIPVSSALKIDDNFIVKYEDNYYMVFDFIDGKTLKDDEITIEHCKQIGEILSKIHSLDYSNLALDTEIKEDHFYVDWKEFTKSEKFNSMSYRDLYLKNYLKYYSIMNRVVQRFNESNTTLALCHRDMDPKNVMWSNGKLVVIDWESASLSNPYRELLEDALCWSGFLSDNFNEEKFLAVVNEYAKNKNISNVDWYLVICGNLIGRFGWLDYNLKRSLGLKSKDDEEMKLAEKEVSKTIDEINRYLELIGTMYDIFHKLSHKEIKTYDEVIKKIIDNNDLITNSSYKLITAGFTNTIYLASNFIVRICTNPKNEERFKNEIDFYNKNKDNHKVPTLYVGDISKSIVPYYYEIMEKVDGKTLYEVWYKLDEIERQNIVVRIIDILKTFHNADVETYNFAEFIKDKISSLLKECELDIESFESLLAICDKYFEVNKFGIIHGDLHFDNFMYDNGKLKLLDFERYMIAPIDYDFIRLARYSSTPWLWASAKTDMLTVESDYQNLMPMFIENYKELQEIPYLEERFKIYAIIDMLNEYKNTHNANKLLEIKSKITTLTK